MKRYGASKRVYPIPKIRYNPGDLKFFDTARAPNKWEYLRKRVVEI